MEAVSPEQAGPQVPIKDAQCVETGHEIVGERGHQGDSTTVGGACAPAVELDSRVPEENGLGHDGGPAEPEAKEEENEVEESAAEHLADEEFAPKVVRVPRVPTRRER